MLTIEIYHTEIRLKDIKEFAFQDEKNTAFDILIYYE